MNQAITERLEAPTDQQAKKRRPQPRAGNRFGTSEAAKRRKAADLDPKAGKGGTTSAVATMLSSLEPRLPPEMRTEVARNIASVATITEGLSVGVIAKIRQSLAKTDSLRVIVETSPDAAKYVRRLVLGEEEGVPHAIRLQAALAVIELSGIRVQATQDERDLSELSLDELQQRVHQAEHAIDKRLTVTEVGNAAPLNPVSHETPSDGTPAQRQAIE